MVGMRALLFLAQDVAGKDLGNRLAIPLAVAVERARLAQHLPDEVGGIDRIIGRFDGGCAGKDCGHGIFSGK
jgi:hypothetical protein